MSEKILLVDDEQDFVETLAERMENRGMEVSATTSASDGLKKATENSFDAIILDLQMPEMDGLELLRILKEKKPDIQVILLTGHATLEKGIEAIKLGAMDFIEKPVDLKILSDKIKQAHNKKMILVEKQTEDKIKKIISNKGW